ncbi:uncharacterized protein C8orf48-like [Anguilla rostrata]|uniref:uncharacterized protein C8orf48-like n=1 Tax=Anguilla rostrata TaxID=7938 RepID=UPI0030CEDCC8
MKLPRTWAHHIIMSSLDQNSGGGQNSLLNYEAESFESWPGSERACTSSRSLESQRTYSYGSDSFLSFGATEFDSQSQSGTTASVEGYENDDFEQYDEKESTMEEELRGKWMGILRTKVPPSSIPPPKQRSNCRLHRGGEKLCPEERAALKAFCQEKIRRARSPRRTAPPAGRTQPSGQTAPRAEMAEPQDAGPVPTRFVSALRLKSFTEEMRKAVGTELHQPSRCGPCWESLARLAEDTFLRRKKSQLESGLLQDRLQAHLLEKDTICLVGELLGDISKTSDDPSKIWQEFMTNGSWSPQ